MTFALLKAGNFGMGLMKDRSTKGLFVNPPTERK